MPPTADPLRTLKFSSALAMALCLATLVLSGAAATPSDQDARASESGVRLYVNSTEGHPIGGVKILWEQHAGYGSLISSEPNPAVLRLPPGEQDFYFVAAGHQTTHLAIDVLEDDLSVQEVTLQRTGIHLTGTIREPATGSPMSGVLVQAETIQSCGGNASEGEGSEASDFTAPASKNRTNEEGRYSLYANPGEVRVTAFSDQHEPIEDVVSFGCESELDLTFNSSDSESSAGRELDVPTGGLAPALAMLITSILVAKRT